MLSYNRGFVDETQEDSATLNPASLNGFLDDSLPSPFEHDGVTSHIVDDSLRQFPPSTFSMARGGGARGGGARGGEPASAVRYSSVHDMVAAHGIVFSTPPSQPQCDATAGCMPLGSLQPLRQPPTAAESIASLYPHCLQEMDSDFDSILRIDWMSCDAAQVYDMLVSPHMQCGSSKSMAWVLQFAVKQLTGVLSCFCSKESDALKVLVSKGIK